MFTSLLLTAAYGKQYKKGEAEKHAKSRKLTARKICLPACLCVLTVAVTYGIILIRQIPKLNILIVRDITKEKEKSVTQRTIYGLIFWKRLCLVKSDA